MIDWLERFHGRRTFPRGVHPASAKDATRERPIEDLPATGIVAIPLHQHAGAPALPVVAKRDRVAAGDLLGEGPPVIGARIHSPWSGRIKGASATAVPNGRRAPAIELEVDLSAGGPTFATCYGGQWSVADDVEPEAIVSAARQAGLVGMGGAAFPTHVKLEGARQRSVEVVLVNGSECEPYLTGDERMMIEAPDSILAGLRLAMAAVGARRGIVAIEDGKPGALRRMAERAAALSLGGVEIVVCQAKYPMGGERQLIPAVLGRIVPTGGLPLDVGVLVLNVQTAAALARAVRRDGPLTHRVLTVAGGGVLRPGNVFVGIGTPVGEILAHCGGPTGDAVRVVAGGPMMGFTITDLSTPVTKATSGLVVLTAAERSALSPGPCIRCGRCVDVCPLGLVPTTIAHAAAAGDIELAAGADLAACCECGCCAHVCPSHIPLVQMIRSGKAVARRHRA